MATLAGALVEKIPAPWYGYQQQQPPPLHQMDEREGFLMWLRGEFAAANAIIDGLCHHLRAVGEPGEYDGVIGCIQQRRCNWSPILHMQPYFSIAEVMYALQQMGWRRQPRARGNEGGARMGEGGKEFRRGGRGQRGGTEVQGFVGQMNGRDLNRGLVKNVNEAMDGGVAKGKLEEKIEAEEEKEPNEISEVNILTKREGDTQGTVAHLGDEVEVSVEGSCACGADGSGLEPEDKQNLELTPKFFVATEICDGKLVNVVEGMKLYETILDDSETSQLIALVNDLRAAGRRGQFPGKTYIVSKKPMRGHGRETIQLGIPSVDAPTEDEAAAKSSKDLKTEPIPLLLEDFIERILKEQKVSTRPDSCIIDIFNEGDYSQPHSWPQWFGRPVFLLSLTECEICFGKAMTMDHPGDYQSALRLSLLSGSMLVMQGRSADFARHALPSLQKQRILVTFVKSLPKKIDSNDVPHFHKAAVRPSRWVPPPSKSPNHSRPAPLLPISTARQPLNPPNDFQPIFIPTPVAAAAIVFPAPVPLSPPAHVRWPATPPRHPPPRLPIPGTGVFLPPKNSGNSSNQHAPTENCTTSPTRAEDCGLEKSISFSSLPKLDGQDAQMKCNGSMDGTGEDAVISKDGTSADLDLSGSGGTI